jgi:GrpB-like predicted nucleotidyltransferase (UPF0157 family)
MGASLRIGSFGDGMAQAEYHPYDDQLPAIFTEIKKLVRQHLTEVLVEHVGSSSVPGIGGRNVLDIAVITSEDQHDHAKNVLKDLGFQDSPFPHYLPLLVASTTWRTKKYFILLYLVSPENQTLKDWIRFRDYMREHPEDAKQYDAVKQAVVAQGTIDGDEYQDAKSPFLQEMLARIK